MESATNPSEKKPELKEVEKKEAEPTLEDGAIVVGEIDESSINRDLTADVGNVEVLDIKATMTVGQKLYIEKLFKVALKDIEGSINGTNRNFRVKVQTALESLQKATIESINKGDLITRAYVQKVDKKYASLYSTLVRDLLLRFERRLVTAELHVSALVDVCGTELARDQVDWNAKYAAKTEEKAVEFQKKNNEANLAGAPESEKKNEPLQPGQTVSGSEDPKNNN